MDKETLNRITELLNNSIDSGIVVFPHLDGLSIRIRRGEEINQHILTDLRENKKYIIEYFDTYFKKNVVSSLDEDTIPIGKIEVNGEEYYETTRIQHDWLDNSVDGDFKKYDNVHGTVLISYEILGKFKTNVFNEAISYVVRRHESLRSTFHKFSGKFYMKVNEGISPLTEIIDLRSKGYDDIEIEKLLKFEDHQFDLEKGPIFMVRLLKFEAKRFVLVLKLHHVIFDTISEEILLRDLQVAYNAFNKKTRPDLPPIKYQHKENLSFINYFVKIHCKEDREYWNSLFPENPKAILLPNTQRTSRRMLDKISKVQKFSFSERITEDLNFLAKKFATSLFVILQATFKGYIQKVTGQSDILIGTDIFGRDYPSTKNQIGCYAKVVLIRTVLNKTDSFESIIKKVKRSNEDMRNHQAFSLKDLLEERLLPGQIITEEFWNINLMFVDNKTTFLEKSSPINKNILFDFEIIPRPQLTNKLIPIDIIIKYVALNEDLSLIVEYDSSLYDSFGIKEFISQYKVYIEQVLQDIEIGIKV